ncbi:MAG: helix-turn-helix transcriptional regulator [Bacilli bacterium]
MIRFDLSVAMAKKKMSVTELSQRLGLSMVNTSLLKNGKIKGVRFATLDKICQILDCTPSDLITYERTKENEKEKN